MPEWLNALIARAIISALVASVIGGGIVYFAFDQALRGVEVAFTTNNSRIDDLSARMVRIEDKIALVALSVSQIQNDTTSIRQQNQKRDEDIADLASSSKQLPQLFSALKEIYGNQYEFNERLLSGLGRLEAQLELISSRAETRATEN